VIFEQCATVTSINQPSFQQFRQHSHNIHPLKTLKNANDWPTLKPVFKVHRQIRGVCIHHYLISSSTMRCWNAVHLWKQMLLQLWQDATLNIPC